MLNEYFKIPKILKTQRELRQKAVLAWRDALRDEYSNEVPDEVFEVCYTRAYDRGVSYGYDTAAEYLDEEIEFAKLIIKITQHKE